MKAKAINVAEVEVELEDEVDIVVVDEVGITTTIPTMKEEKVQQEVVEEAILI